MYKSLQFLDLFVCVSSIIVKLLTSTARLVLDQFKLAHLRSIFDRQPAI